MWYLSHLQSPDNTVDFADMGNAAADEDAVELARRLAGGSSGALNEVYQRYSALVFTLALRLLNNREDAEDVTQSTFVAAWQSRENLQVAPNALPRWLVGIARHRIADVREQRRRSSRNLQAVAQTTSTEVATDETRQVADRLLIANALQDIGPPKSQILWMAYAEGARLQDVADHLEMPLSTVKSHARRGLLQLRSLVEEVSDGTAMG